MEGMEIAHAAMSGGSALSYAAGGMVARQQAPGGRSSNSSAMTYADVSRGIQRIFKERQEPLSVARLEEVFAEQFGVTIYEVAGIPTSEYLLRKENVFEYDDVRDRVFLQPSILAGPPIADPNLPKDENFVLDEFERLIEDLGPVCYVSALCGKFIQRNGVSVTSITSMRPLDLFKRHPERFIVVGGGNVSLVKYKDHPEVTALVMKSTSKAQRASRAQQDARLPAPEVVTEEDVVEEFRRLIQQDGADSVYISSLCGRFLQRFRKPVTAIISSRPADFLRKYPDVFELVGGGNVRLRAPPTAESIQDIAAVPMALPATTAQAAAGLMRATSHRGGDGSVLVGDPAHAGISLDHGTCRRLLELIAPPQHNERLAERAQELCDTLKERFFLCISRTVLGGAIGKGIATTGVEEAEITLFVDQLPDADHEKWLPHVLETLLAVLEMALGGRAHGFCTDGRSRADLVLLANEDADKSLAPGKCAASSELHASIQISPIFRSREHLFECLRKAPISSQRYYAPSLARDAVDIVRQQSETVKDAMRLIRWWSAKQKWSQRSTPPAYLLELVTIHASMELSGTSDLAEIIERVLDHCADIAELRVLWNGTGVANYGVFDIWQPLLLHKPLVMDPTNPCVNVADSSSFDSAELSARAARGQPRRLGLFLQGVAQAAAEAAR
mmetsp:Transcript_89141/g.252729  ORF Transcript_89141/g.252729 Transcript_89141/m.252729 type:complete len:674 (+) Transcript_89141:155-2176(+)